MDGQRVLVTAGASGIGWAVVQAFVAAGARVHIADVDADAVASAVSDSVTGTVCDVSDPVGVERLFADLSESLGGLDVLVNNAGIAGPTAPVEDYPREGWDAVVAINLTATFAITQRAIPLLKASPRASIIVMSSVAGRFGYPRRVAYSTTKWGLVGFAKTLALELGEFGITANAIHPGAVAGPRIERVLAGRAEAAGTDVETERAKAVANQSIPALTDPADIGALAVFLASEHGRSISGQSLPVDGDSKAAQ
ncbi:SDR family oxidoreductase [Actinomycetospora termitidis]|uniref:SDR family oxidoreductase n=1 Tax=Actinomycetospora termitidis TaxID=3053470 RepID=A0ABT7M672_9PSEU|nr:SDR family oxidoreductase [Actinomycetospora sp. Odt1-22]MDL5156154.1 SDR family oxidoreductase [Actinomycetospora sp. Odt1-22]